jgi:hypothetical protein
MTLPKFCRRFSAVARVDETQRSRRLDEYAVRFEPDAVLLIGRRLTLP